MLHWQGIYFERKEVGGGGGKTSAAKMTRSTTKTISQWPLT